MTWPLKIIQMELSRISGKEKFKKETEEISCNNIGSFSRFLISLFGFIEFH